MRAQGRKALGLLFSVFDRISVYLAPVMYYHHHGSGNDPDHHAMSGTMRTIRDQIQAGDFADALSTLNTLLANSSMGNNARGRLLCFVADTQFAQGDYADAITSYQQAGSYLQTSMRFWLRPGLGQVLSLLRNAQPDEALTYAQALVQNAVTVYAQHPPPATPPSNHTMVMGRPWNPSTVAVRLGKQFLAEGEIASARTIFTLGHTVQPQSSTFTLAAQADLAERGDQLADAASYAQQALAAGNYLSKTISIWPQLLRINLQLGTPGVSADLLANLSQAQPSVRARALLLIAKTLRSQGVAQWIDITNSWLASADASALPKVVVEFNKLLLSTGRLQSAPPDQQVATATQLEALPALSPQEFLFAIKEQVRASCFSTTTSPADWQALVTQMVQLYGAGYQASVTHSLALSYMMGQRQDLARPVLQANIAATVTTDPEWAKSVSALARMESLLGNHDTAAQWYLALCQNAGVAQRFQLYALLNWVNETSLSSATPDQTAAAITQARPQLQSAIGQITDYGLLLDLGRQLSLLPAIQDLAGGAMDKGVQLAQQIISNLLHPNFHNGDHPGGPSPGDAVAPVAVKLAQRQSDLQRYGDITTFWENLGAGLQSSMWTAKTGFWQYVALVFQAYDRSGNGAAAESLAATYINDPATPSAAAPLIAVPYGLYLIDQGRSADALQTFSWAVAQSPSAKITAAAYYWLALSAWNSSNTTGAANFAGNLLVALGQHSGKLADQQLAGKALLIQAGLNPASVSTQAVAFDPTTLQPLLASIQADLASLQ